MRTGTPHAENWKSIAGLVGVTKGDSSPPAIAGSDLPRQGYDLRSCAVAAGASNDFAARENRGRDADVANVCASVKSTYKPDDPRSSSGKLP